MGGGLKEAIAFTTRVLVKLASAGPAEIRNLVCDGAESETSLIHGLLKEQHGISTDLMNSRKSLTREGQQMLKDRFMDEINLAGDEEGEEESKEEKKKILSKQQQ